MTSIRPPLKDEEQKRRLRDVLRSLEKIKAPWYFEATLEQRIQRVLRAPKKKRGKKAFLVIVVLILLAAGYFYFTGDLERLPELIWRLIEKG